MRKRQKFVLTAFLLGLGLAVLQNFPLEVRYLLIGVLTVATWGLAVWSLREGLSNIEWLTVPLPPTLFTLGVGLFFIFPLSHSTIPQILFSENSQAVSEKTFGETLHK
jgi:hypothetical protein